jgi:hypothetical protein
LNVEDQVRQEPIGYVPDLNLNLVESESKDFGTDALQPAVIANDKLTVKRLPTSHAMVNSCFLEIQIK